MTLAASVVVVAFNSRDDLEDCLPALRGQTQADYEVIVVDNGSTDGTAEWIAAEHPWVRLAQSADNLGFAGGNNLGFGMSDAPVLAGINPDTVASPGWLAALVDALVSGDADLVTSRIVHHDHPDRVNTCGNLVHVTGLGFCRGLDLPASDFVTPVTVAAISGCAFAIRRKALGVLGGFDPDFFMYSEDTDLSVRALVAGMAIEFIPDSVVRHKYALRLTAAKFELIERNRVMVLAKNLRGRTLVLLLPVMAAMELAMWCFASLRGRAYLAAKLRAYRALAARRETILARRREVRRLRRRRDRAVLDMIQSRVPAGQVLPRGAAGSAISWIASAGFGALSLPARLLSD